MNIWALLVIVLAALTIWSLQWYRSGRRHGVALVCVLSLLLIASASLSWILPSQLSEERAEAAGWSEALGEVVGRETARLAPGGGRVIVFVTPALMARRDERLRVRRSELLRGLSKGLGKKFSVKVFEPSVAPMAMGNGIFCWPDLQAALQTHPDVRAVVNFLPVHRGLLDVAGDGARKLPSLIVCGAPEKLAQEWLDAGFIRLAIVDRSDIHGDLGKEPRGSAQEIFEQRFRLMQ